MKDTELFLKKLYIHQIKQHFKTCRRREGVWVDTPETEEEAASRTGYIYFLQAGVESSVEMCYYERNFL